MKKLMVLAATAALLAGVSMSSFAAGKSLEERCKALAEKHKIAEDKMDAYVKTCVEKHTKKVAKADTAHAAAPAGQAPAGK
jgi:hypothetical protein